MRWNIHSIPLTHSLTIPLTPIQFHSLLLPLTPTHRGTAQAMDESPHHCVRQRLPISLAIRQQHLQQQQWRMQSDAPCTCMILQYSYHMVC